jgi:putative oxidoreductase
MGYDLPVEQRKDEVILASRVLLMLLFLITGWDKLTGFSSTVGYMAAGGVPLPAIATIIAIVMELLAGLALVIGLYTRPLALLFAVYTLATALIGHHFWTMAGVERMASVINFYKNVSIIGGLLLLYVTGAGKYSVDHKLSHP